MNNLADSGDDTVSRKLGKEPSFSIPKSEFICLPCSERSAPRDRDGHETAG
jgi:hypothetical protein